jgi:hypothetical protein
MQRVHIFGSKHGFPGGEGLWAVRYEPGTEHAFRSFFSEMENPEWVYNFCINNLEDLAKKFGYRIEAEKAALELMKEAQALKAKLVALAQGLSPGKTLQELFRPLNNSESDLRELQLSKGSVNSTTKNPKLRIYAVRVDEKTFVVTGGAIKLTDGMEERRHTDNELKKMRRVKTWLKEEGICFREDLNELS